MWPFRRTRQSRMEMTITPTGSVQFEPRTTQIRKMWSRNRPRLAYFAGFIGFGNAIASLLTASALGLLFSLLFVAGAVVTAQKELADLSHQASGWFEQRWDDFRCWWDNIDWEETLAGAFVCIVIVALAAGMFYALYTMIKSVRSDSAPAATLSSPAMATLDSLKEYQWRATVDAKLNLILTQMPK